MLVERSDTTEATEAKPTELVKDFVMSAVVVKVATKPKAKEQLMLMMLVLLILTAVVVILFDFVEICKNLK